VKTCQCDTYKNHQKALADANAKVKAANTKAWTEAAHFKCVLAGKSTNSCTVPPLPQVKATSVATGVGSDKCAPKWAGGSQCKYAVAQQTSNDITVKRNSGNNNWEAGCFMQAQVPANRKKDYMVQQVWTKGSAAQGYTMAGFEQAGQAGHKYQQINWAAYCWVNVNMYIYEKGNGRGHQAGCPCQSKATTRVIMKKDNTVEYWMQQGNGSWKKCYTSGVKAQSNTAYVVDQSIYQQGSTMQQKLYVGSASNNQWTPAP